MVRGGAGGRAVQVTCPIQMCTSLSFVAIVVVSRGESVLESQMGARSVFSGHGAAVFHGVECIVLWTIFVLLFSSTYQVVAQVRDGGSEKEP